MVTKKPFSDRVFVKRLPRKGYGVFAARPFRKGETILPIKGEILTSRQANRRSRYELDHMYTLGRNKYIIAQYPDKYINHSCEPNVFEKNRNILAMRNLKQGEELCFHYAFNVLEEFRMKCRCNSPHCQGALVGNFFRLPKAQQKKFAPYLDDWFKKEFDKELKGLM